jgi:isochorismate synthase
MPKQHFNSLGEIISYCTSEKLAFALYSLPDEKQIHCIAQDTAVSPLEENSTLPSAPGFILYPFQYSKTSPTYFIRADHRFSFLNEDITKADLSGNYQFDIAEISNIETDKEKHCSNIETAVSAIKKGEFEKVILSRVQSVESRNLSPITSYVELFEKYPSAFVSLVYIPGKVLWLTATPELLVASDRDEIRTVALAGTKKTGKGNWSDKEKKEQQLVTDYIYNVLSEHCEKVRMSGPEEVEAGNVAHLRTIFTAQPDSGLWDLVMDLHPTPAVCGVPKESALKFIQNTESHKRKYYSGFLGACNIEGETNLFVNLRCAELSQHKADLFIGGGITADSEPVAEWDETVLKANTLLSVLKPVAEKAV